MKIIEFEDGSSEICEISCEVEKDRLYIRWKWPKNTDIVYVMKTDNLDDLSLNDAELKSAKLYTMEEYKEFNGYCESIKEINQYRYYVFPAVESDDDILLVKQNNGKNQIVVSTGKPDIYYDIKEVKSLKGLFSKDKKLQITIKSEIPLHKDVLCYVKKRDSYPVNNKDGISFDFICDIHVGINEMPEITVKKDEYVKVFIKDIDKYGGSYRLKQI
ncbi:MULTISPECIES: hypothetical protein [Clostridium]|uniref:Beta-mannanase n=2 Tax=Clostridium TaxID=1485 RepID=D8GN32_CLOLD|nr:MULTISPECIES: hypothetical protein [Clostridium]ADK13656.1 hypothetical protein CLJU_c05740 [Clostridium ljungdahlii DSM 13528]OAA84519.1 hypothetical protein WX45_00987 [Clostridium ljungdahlii DSM 13528]RMD01867.1 hypothetical protein D9O40_07415 [Clostridium autoethanogenum]